MKIQYQTSNGRWLDCDERTDEFLTRCEKFNGKDADGLVVPAFQSVRLLTRDEVISALDIGITLRDTGDGDWYDNCRDSDAIERIQAERRAAMPAVKMVKCACGHTIPASSVMSTSMGSSCPDCYDRMSC